MSDPATLATFLGWCSLLNLGVYLLSALAVSALRRYTLKIHARLFDQPVEHLPALYFQFLGNYKIALIVFNLVPYLALRLMGY